MSAPVSETPTLSILIPLRDEEDALEPLFTRLFSVLEGLSESFEIVCIDDGSIDGTRANLIARHQADPRIKVVGLARGFGKERALSAGLDHVCGDAVVPLDADLQDPPEVIKEFFEKWREGFDVVYGVRRSRDEGLVKRVTAKAFYRIFNALTDVKIPEDTGDFRLMDRKVVEALRELPENNRFMKGLFGWVGFRQTGIPYDRAPRSAGTSKWSYWKLWNFALDGITGFSTLPLRLWSYFGALIALLSFIYAVYMIVKTLVLGIDVPGYASLMVVVLFLGGVQLITLGIFGEYLGRLYRESKRRPVYVVDRLYGFERDKNERNKG